MDSNFGFIASSPSHYPVKWEVKNNCDFPVRIQWINFEGKTNDNGFVVAPGETQKPGTTYVGHVFLVTNSATNSFHVLLNIMGVKTEIDPDLYLSESIHTDMDDTSGGGTTTSTDDGSIALEPIKERQALTIDGNAYQLRGRVLTNSGKPAAGVLVSAFDKDLISKDDYLGSAITADNGGFEIAFKKADFMELFLDQKPDIYLEVSASGVIIHSTEDAILRNADENISPITLVLA